MSQYSNHFSGEDYECLKFDGNNISQTYCGIIDKYYVQAIEDNNFQMVADDYEVADDSENIQITDINKTQVSYKVTENVANCFKFADDDDFDTNQKNQNCSDQNNFEISINTNQTLFTVM